MARYIAPPTFDVPYGGSFGNVIGDVGDAITNYMISRDQIEQRKKEEKRQAILDRIAAEDRILQIAPHLSGFTPPDPTRVGPTEDELGVPPTMRKEDLSAPLLTELTLPDGGKLKIPAIRGMKEQADFQRQLEAEKGTEVLSEAAWNELPPFYKARWKPGQRVNSDNVGKIGQEVFDAANRKAEALAERGARATGDEAERKSRESIAAANRASAEKIAGMRISGQGGDDGKIWVTQKGADGSTVRVRVTQKELDEAPPGKYTDEKPIQPKVNLSAQAAQSRDAAMKVLGSADDPESLWGIAQKWTLPGPGNLMGPAAAATGVGRSAIKALRLPGSADLRQYETIIEGFTPLFARSVGHTGVLTEKDELRTRKLFPVLTGPGADSQSEAIRKLQRLQRIMSKQEVVPAGLFDSQPGAWPPQTQDQSSFSPDEVSLMSDYGY